MKQTFTRKEVIDLVQELLERPDILIDAIQNEYTDWTAEELVEYTENLLGYYPGL